jgi:hypothetical protein
MLSGTYNFKEVDLVFGTRKIEGFEDGTEIVVERAEDSFTEKVDVDGNVTRSRSNNTMGTITFTLSQFSEANKYLQDLMNLDERSGTGVVPAKINDKSNPSEELAIASQAWLRKPASKSFGRESGPREWVIACADLNFK